MKKTCDTTLTKKNFLPPVDPKRFQQLQMQKEFENIMASQRSQFLYRDPFQEYMTSMPPSLMNMQPWNQLPPFPQSHNRANPLMNPFAGLNPLDMDPFMNSSLQFYLQLAECQNIFACNNNPFNKVTQPYQPKEVKKPQATLDEKSNDCAKTETTVEDNRTEDTKTEEIQQIKSNGTDKQKELSLDQKVSEPLTQGDEAVLNPKELEFGLDNSFNSWDLEEQDGDQETFLEESINSLSQNTTVKENHLRNKKETYQQVEINSLEPAKRKRVKKY